MWGHVRADALQFRRFNVMSAIMSLSRGDARDNVGYYSGYRF